MEMLNVVDENDRIVGIASKKDVYEKLLPHRIVHVFMFNKKGELALQLQGRKKKYCPLHWGTTAGGHVQAGESYEQAMHREFVEEVGADVPMTHLGNDLFIGPKGIRKMLAVFRAEYEGPFYPNPREVEKVEFFSLERIREMIAAGEKFHPELLFLLRKHFGFA
jgi:isopentenyldiphosphate isomerase